MRRILLLKLPLEIIHESRLRIGRLGPVNIEQKDTIVLYQNLEVKEVQENGGLAHKNVG